MDVWAVCVRPLAVREEARCGKRREVGLRLGFGATGQVCTSVRQCEHLRITHLNLAIQVAMNVSVKVGR